MNEKQNERHEGDGAVVYIVLAAAVNVIGILAFIGMLLQLGFAGSIGDAVACGVIGLGLIILGRLLWEAADRRLRR